ncbi:Rhs element Vgr protein [Desulfuromonas soudanensis]|uniref:Rhs element Vgr protein n=1 Tax=Desulfuromonas soudanensis TaxID=1603606 RepID=A0A0M3QGH2_9BACT|nr:type VI secretion system tip protein TssI/VgrG [Desulfuromonas soudanensis]ALC17969.1 Rhs element Vgr protein [Desulfuromonas soudanensis]
MHIPSLAAGKIDAPANRSQFACSVRGIPDETFSVRSFSGKGHALGGDYRFRIELLASSAIDTTYIIGRPAALHLAPGGEVPIHGVILEVAYGGAGANGHEYQVEFASPLAPLGMGRRHRVFLGKTAPKIIEEVLLGGGFAAGDFELRLKENHPAREFTVQFDESDLAFIKRLAAGAGIFFRFEVGSSGSRLLFHDGVGDLPHLGSGPLRFQLQTGAVRDEETIFAFTPRARLLSQKVELRDYNDQTPEVVLEAYGSPGTAVAGAGTDYRFGEHFRDMAEGAALARIRQQALDCQRETFVAESDCRGLSPGLRITLTGHPESGNNGDYLVVDVEHAGEQGAAFAYGGSPGRMTYRNKALLVRDGVAYRPVPIPRRLHGTYTARIESSGGEYAFLDEQGRYRIRADFDLGDAQKGSASHPVRLMQPAGGDNCGLHFPLHPGTEVVFTCINGDIDRPILLGVLANPDTPSPVTSANSSENILRTKGGNELLMDDRRGKEKVELFTAERKNLLALDADSEGHRVRLASEEGTMELFAAKTLLLDSGETQTVEAGGDHIVTVENAQRLMTKNKEIELQAATDILLKAGENILMQAEGGEISLMAGENLLLDVGETFSVEVRNRNLEILADQGNISIRAAGALSILGQGGGTIHLGQGGGAIEISAEGDLTIDAPRVEINGQSIGIKGASLVNN